MEVIDTKNNIKKILDNKAQNITCIDLKNKSYIADYMVIASGRSRDICKHYQKFLLLN